MSPMRGRPRGAAWWLLVLAACAGEPPVPEALEEASVHPGINDPYLGEIRLEEWIERFEGEGRELYTQRAEILDALQLRAGMVVADVGAGTGLFTLPIAERVGPRGRACAVDIVPEFLELIRTRAAAAGLDNIDLVLGSARSAELAADTVDLVFVCDTYHHFEYPQTMLASLRQALRCDGELVVVDFKRIPNVSSEWIMEHVRAGEETVIQEILRAGFVLVAREDFLESNYFLRFRKAAAPR